MILLIEASLLMIPFCENQPKRIPWKGAGFRGFSKGPYEYELEYALWFTVRCTYIKEPLEIVRASIQGFDTTTF